MTPNIDFIKNFSARRIRAENQPFFMLDQGAKRNLDEALRGILGILQDYIKENSRGGRGKGHNRRDRLGRIHEIRREDKYWG